MALKKLFFLIIVLSFIIPLAYSFYFRIHPSVDARAYDNIAYNLASGRGYRESLDIPLEMDYSLVRVGPGYEFFLAGLYYIFGHRYWPVWIVQSLLQALAAVLTFLIAKEIFKKNWDPKIGLVAAAFVGFSPDLITISAMLLSETLAIFLVLLSVYLFFKYYSQKKLFLILALGAVFGFTALVRTPVFLLLIPFFIFLIKNKRWLHISLLVLTIFFIFLPWSLRNYKIYHKFIPTNAALGYNLVAGNHSGASGELEPYLPLSENFKKLGPIKTGEIAQKEALQFIFAHPLEFIKVTLYRISMYFSFARPTGFWPYLSGLNKIITLIVSSFYAFLLFTAGFIGISQIKKIEKEDRKKVLYFLSMLVLMPLGIIWIVVETRYRFLIYPFLAIFSGYACLCLRAGWLRIKSLSLLISSIFILNTILTPPEIFPGFWSGF